jgi:hypothetical protein
VAIQEPDCSLTPRESAAEIEAKPADWLPSWRRRIARKVQKIYTQGENAESQSSLRDLGRPLDLQLSRNVPVRGMKSVWLQDANKPATGGNCSVCLAIAPNDFT